MVVATCSPTVLLASPEVRKYIVQAQKPVLYDGWNSLVVLVMIYLTLMNSFHFAITKRP